MDLKWIFLAVFVLAVVVNQQVIAENESRPKIWTSGNKDYGSEIGKHSAWDELFKKYYQDDINSDERDIKSVFQLKKIWKSIWDCIEEKNNKKSLRYTKNRRKSIICDVLSLLALTFAEKSTDMDDETLSNKEKKEENQSNKFEVLENTSNFINNKINQEDSLFKELSNKFNNDHEKIPMQPKPEEKLDHAKDFLMSLLEDFKAIPKMYKVDAKFEILAVLRKFNKYSEMTSTPEPAPLTPEYMRLESAESNPDVLSDLFAG